MTEASNVENNPRVPKFLSESDRYLRLELQKRMEEHSLIENDLAPFEEASIPSVLFTLHLTDRGEVHAVLRGIGWHDDRNWLCRAVDDLAQGEHSEVNFSEDCDRIGLELACLVP